MRKPGMSKGHIVSLGALVSIGTGVESTRKLGPSDPCGPPLDPCWTPRPLLSRALMCQLAALADGQCHGRLES